MARKNRRRLTPQDRRRRRVGRVRRWLHAPFRLVLLGLLGVALGLIAYEVGVFLYTSPAFAVRVVEVRGAQRTRVADLLEAGRVEEGVNVFSVDLERVRNRLQELPWVRSASTTRTVPDTLIIEVEEYHPVALINLGGLYYLDRTREVFKRVQAGERVDLPVLTGFSRAAFQDRPERVDGAIADSLRLLEQLRACPCLRARRVAEIHQDELMGPTVVLDPGAVSVRLGRQRPGRRLGQLCRLLARLGQHELQPHTILLDHGLRPGWATVRVESGGDTNRIPGS